MRTRILQGYCFNPFSKDSPALAAIVDKIVGSVRQHPRQVFVIHVNPKQEHVFLQRGFEGFRSVRYNNREYISFLKLRDESVIAADAFGDKAALL